MNPHELFLFLTALLGRRLALGPDSAPSSLRLARERMAAARARTSADPLASLEALRSAPRQSRPSHP